MMDVAGWLIAIAITALYGWFMYYRGVARGAVGLSNLLVKIGIVKSVPALYSAIIAYRNKVKR